MITCANQQNINNVIAIKLNFRELYSDLKSLDTIVSIHKRVDMTEILEYLGFKKLKDFDEEFGDAINYLKMTSATEKLLKIMIKKKNIFTL